MIIGVKYWDEGASVPGSWTNLDVLTFSCQDTIENADAYTALDGYSRSFNRVRYLARIVLAGLQTNNATYRSRNYSSAGVIENLMKADYARIKDTRYPYLGDTNTINFSITSGSPDYQRPSFAVEKFTLDLKAVEEA